MNRCCISSGLNFNSLIKRSTLFMKRIGRTLSRSACLKTVSVCGITLSTASTTINPPSTALVARITSPPKSTWPGVSIRLIKKSFPSKVCTSEMLAALIVIPLACSCGSKSSERFSPANSSEINPEPRSKLSESVVFPWSMWATIPMFLI